MQTSKWVYFRGNGNYLVAASQHRDALKLFELKRKVKTIRVNPTDVSALLTFKNGKTEKKEFYVGSSFLSQSARLINVDENVSGFTIYDNKGVARLVQF